jgi:hypothetical protein
MNEFGIAPCPCCGTEASFQMVPLDGSAYAGGHFIECGNGRCGLSSVLIKGQDIEIARRNLLSRWNLRVAPVEGEQVARPKPEPPKFPTAVRKMWSGGEVQEWIDRAWEKL